DACGPGGLQCFAVAVRNLAHIAGARSDRAGVIGFRQSARGGEDRNVRRYRDRLTDRHVHIVRYAVASKAAGDTAAIVQEVVHAHQGRRSPGALGITTRNSAPRPPGPSPTSIEPPAVVTRCLQTARPRPVPAPAALVVKNGSNTRARSVGGTPGPSSVTVIRVAMPPGAGRAVIEIVPPSILASAMACAAFWPRLTRTCWRAWA